MSRGSHRGRWVVGSLALSLGCAALVLGTTALISAVPAAATGSTYVIGNIGTYTGALSGDYNSDPQVLKAWAEWTNAHGGINGHPVKVISLDDQGNPSTVLQDSEKLVQQDHILAMVDVNTNGGPSFAPYLQTQKVPVIGATSNPPGTTDLYYYPVGTGEVASVYGTVASGKLVSAKNIAVVYCAESPTCAEIVGAVKSFGSPNGEAVTYSAAAPESAPSYASYCLAAKQSGATALITALTSASTVGVAQSCSQQNYHPTFLVVGAPVGPAFLGQSALNGSIATTAVFPYVLDNTPATEAFHQALKKYAPSVLKSSTYNVTTADAWADAQMFAAAAAKMKTATPAGLVKALDSLRNVTLGGLIAPESFSATQQANPTCYAYMKQVSGKYVPVDGGHFQCMPAS